MCEFGWMPSESAPVKITVSVSDNGTGWESMEHLMSFD